MKITQDYKKNLIKSMITKASSLELELVWIPKIINLQTYSEVHREDTEEKNGVGLSAYDAPFITSIYHRIEEGQHLTYRMEAAVKKALPKYWKQYANMMNFKE
jgi:hypothetical protein